jgi:hypothetical protein
LLLLASGGANATVGLVVLLDNKHNVATNKRLIIGERVSVIVAFFFISLKSLLGVLSVGLYNLLF